MQAEITLRKNTDIFVGLPVLKDIVVVFLRVINLLYGHFFRT